VVFDHVVSANPAFRNYWLLHTLEEPRIDSTPPRSGAAGSAVVDCTRHGSSGRLMLDVLLPSAGNADLVKVGGPGRDFWVFGQNYTNDVEPQRLERRSIGPGAWTLCL
jgi:hypothetical protein